MSFKNYRSFGAMIAVNLFVIVCYICIVALGK